MRKAFILVAVALLVLVACAETPEPTPPPVASPSPAAATPTARSIPPTNTAQPSPTSTAASDSDAEPTAQPPLPTPEPTMPSAESPWPVFLRELNFGIPAGNSYGPRALAIHPGLGRLYARTHRRGADGDTAGMVTVLDLDSGQVLATVETGPDDYSEGALVLDPSLNRIYAVNPGDSTTSVLDAETLEPVTILDGVDQIALDVENRRLYAAGSAGLRVLDAASYDLLQEGASTPGGEALALAVDPQAGRVYLAHRDGAGYALSLYDTATLEMLASAPLPGSPDALLADAARGRVYATASDDQQNYLWTLDSDGRLVDSRPLGTWTQNTYLTIDSAGERLFLGREVYEDPGVTILDLSSGREVADIPLDRGPNALAWDGPAGRLLVSYTYADQIGVVDVTAGRQSAILPTALDLVDVAVDGQRGHLYVTETAGRLHMLDTDTDQELAVLPGAGLLSVDSPHGRIYTGGQGADRVRIFDADRLEQSGEIRSTARPVADAYYGGLYLVKQGIYLTSLETMTITGVISDTLPQSPGFSPNPAAVNAVVDPGSGRVFAIINNGVPGSNNGNYLYVYEPVTYQKVLTDTERSPGPIDIDPNTGRAYVSRIYMTERSTSLLEDGREYTARLEAVYGALRVDPELGRVFVSVGGDDEGQMLVLDADTLDVLGSVPIPAGFALRALDPQRHLLVLATGAGRVQIWSATGGELPPALEPVPGDPSAEGIQQLFLAPGDSPIFATTQQGNSLYRSDDDGRSWQDIGRGLPDKGVQKLVVSPAWAQDQTLFAVLVSTDGGLGIWKSTDAGRSWRMANAGLTDLAATDLAPSPAFAIDQTLFATAQRGGLYRSTDGGRSWVSLSGRYYLPEAPERQATALAISPTYAQDQTLYVSQQGLQRSTDGGETWERVFAEELSTALSPDFAEDHMVYGWTGNGGLLRSADGGETWQPASVGLILAEYGSGRVLVPADYPASQTVYLIWDPSSPDAPIQYFRSTDGAESWERLADEPMQAATPVQLSADGAAFLALDEAGRLLRWPIGGLDWRAMSPPAVEEILFNGLVASPQFAQDRTLFALSEGAGILGSDDGGLTWTDTGFPFRMTLGGPVELLRQAPDRLFVGTPLGLYRWDGSGPWSPVGGGLPQGVAVSTPQVGQDGSLSVRVDGAGEARGPRVFLSTDGGQTWTQPIPRLPHAIAAEDLRLSPAFATDHTAFIATSWQPPLRTLGGSEWEAFGPPGDWILSALHLSPAFDRDGLLFMRLLDNSLWRSTDRGDTWTDVSGPWGGEAPMGVTLGTGYLLDALTFSPDFAQDGVILTRAGDTLYRSTDQGTTWARVLDLDPSPAKVVFTPQFARDGTLYLLQGRTLHRSTDRGQTWQALSQGPWGEFDETRLDLSPTFSQDRTMVVWTFSGQVYQSSDGGLSWREASAGLPSAAIRQILFSTDYAVDGLLYLLPYDKGLYKQVGLGPWLPVTEHTVPPTPERPPSPTPTPLPTPAPTPLPTPAPTPVTCALEPVRFRTVWQQVQDRLGCPEQPAQQLLLAEQPFERGRMIWDSGSLQIYVMMDAGTWQAYQDTFQEGVDPETDPNLPPPPRQPKRGFGKVWREQLGGPQAAIGWALEEERAVDGWRQRFERGLLYWTDATMEGTGVTGTAYLLYDDGTWQAVAMPMP
jgi:photosystem II stability/assembly factor-like uncharacterized protein/DNA-binding beta-propeller fold protein YncE